MTKQRQPALSKPNLIIPQGNVQVLWFAKVDRVTLSNNMERAKTASSSFTAG